MTRRKGVLDSFSRRRILFELVCQLGPALGGNPAIDKHVNVAGLDVAQGGPELADELDENGYDTSLGL